MREALKSLSVLQLKVPKVEKLSGALEGCCIFADILLIYTLLAIYQT